MAWFMPDETAPGKEHGEAPWPAVLALALTALLTIAFFFFHGATLELERQVVENLS